MKYKMFFLWGEGGQSQRMLVPYMIFFQSPGKKERSLGPAEETVFTQLTGVGEVHYLNKSKTFALGPRITPSGWAQGHSLAFHLYTVCSFPPTQVA